MAARRNALNATIVFMLLALVQGGAIAQTAKEYQEQGRQIIAGTKPSSQNSDEGDPQIESLHSKLDKLTVAVEAISKTLADRDSGKTRDALTAVDVLSRAEQRIESLRKQFLELVEKEGGLRAKAEVLRLDLRPEAIERAILGSGFIRADDARNDRRARLSAELGAIETLLQETSGIKAQVSESIGKAVLLVSDLERKLAQAL